MESAERTPVPVAHQSSTHANPSRLVIESGENQGMIFPLREKVVSIGRGPENTIQIIDTRMSRNHSALIFNDKYWFLRDLNSKNGTLVGDRPIQSDYHLKGNDRIQIGDTVFIFEQEMDLTNTGTHSSGVCVIDDENSSIASKSIKLSQSKDNQEDLSKLSKSAIGDKARLQVLYRMADLTSSILDLDELLDRIVGMVEQILEPERVGILLYDERFNILLPKAIRRPEGSQEDIIISNAIINQAVDERVAVIVNNAPADQRFKSSDSIVIQKIQSAICAPLIYKDDVLGVLYLDRRRPGEGFETNDLELVASIANQSALAISNSRLHLRLLERRAQERELEIARSIQEHLLPLEMPKIAGFEIAGRSEPARMVGGDYYDVIKLPDGRIVIAVADVSGKGVPAALLTSSVRAAVQVEVRNLGADGLVSLVERLNQMVCRDTTNNMFVTMIIGVLDPGQRRLNYINAGHEHPRLRLADGSHQMLDVGGCFLGVMPGTVYEQGEIELPVGSMLICNTDGMTDMINEDSEMFGSQTVLNLINDNPELSAAELCLRIHEAVSDFRGEAEPFDDFTVVILKSLAD